MGRNGSVAVDSTETRELEGVSVAEGSIPAPEPKWDKSLNIFARLILAQRDAAKLEKTQAKNGLKYDYVTHDDIASEAKRVLAKHGVLFFPTIVNNERDGNMCIVTVKASFYNADNPVEALETIGFGYGVDGQDKGPGKAYSYACKYILAKTLLLNTSDDVEQFNTDFKSAESPAAIQEIKDTAEKAVKSWADNFKSAIDECSSYEGLKELKLNNKEMLQSPTVPDHTKTFFTGLLKEKMAVLREAIIADEDEEAAE